MIKRIVSAPFLKEALSSSKTTLLILVSVLIVQSLLILILPLPLREVINNLDDSSYFTKMIGLSFILCLTSVFFEYIEGRLKVVLTKIFRGKLRLHFLQKILLQTYRAKSTRSDIDLTVILEKDVKNLESFILALFIAIFRSVPTILLLLAAILFIEIRILFFLLVIAPIYLLFTRSIIRSFKTAEKNLIKAERRLESELFLYFDSALPIKNYNAEDFAAKVLNGRIDSVYRKAKSRYEVLAKVETVFRGMRLFAAPILIVSGGLALQSGTISLGDLIVLASYFDSLQRPIFQISKFWTKSGKGLSSLERLRDLDKDLNQSKENLVDINSQSTNVVITDKERPFLEIGDISFKWNLESEAYSLSKASLEGNLMESIAIIGESGGGKTTLFKLLNNLITPEGGVRRLGQAPYETLSLTDLRSAVRLILQEDYTMDDSIRENILLGSQSESEISDEDIWRSLKLANLDKFVASLSEGLDSLLGSKGILLSGGQKKKLSLARSFLDLDKVRILVIDEPTTGLDPDSAEAVLRSIKALCDSGKIVIWSTHNHSELTYADRVLEMSNGVLTEKQS